MARSAKPMDASCHCGQVVFRISGAPIMHAACYCTSCRTAGRAFDQEASSPPVVADDGGTDLVLYRKDRVVQTSGAGLLEEHWLTPESPTRRLVATCCHSPMMLDFTKGHWLSLYRGRLSGEVPALDMRVMTQDKPAGVTLPDDAPAYATHSAGSIWKLLSAGAAMGFRRPQLAW